jgi:hypothetical protein
MYLSFACIIMTIIVPHAEPEEDMLGTVIHWSSALLFGVFSAAAIILFLYYKAKPTAAIRLRSSVLPVFSR